MGQLGLYARGGESRRQINAQKGPSTIEIALPPTSAAAVGRAWGDALLAYRDGLPEGSLDILRVPFCGCIDKLPGRRRSLVYARCRTRRSPCRPLHPVLGVPRASGRS